MMRTLISIKFAAVLMLGSSFAFAAGPTYKDRREAQKLAAEAKKLGNSGNIKKALKKYKAADELTPSATYKAAIVKMLLGREEFVEAGEILEECLDLDAKQWAAKQAKKKCEALEDQVDERTPTIEIKIVEPSADDVNVQIDGDDVDPGDDYPFDPSTVEIVAEADGYETWTKEVKLKEGNHKTIKIEMVVSSASPDDDDEEYENSGGFSPVPAYVAFGVGAVGLVVGSAFGVKAIQTTNEVLKQYDDNCPDGKCNQQQKAEAEANLDIAKTNGNISTAGFVIGGVGITAGIVLIMLSGEDDDSSSDDGDDEHGMLGIEARPIIGAGFLGIEGSF